jgi:molybdopterin-guanine dinucleotide biosynthesis protein A
MLSYAAVVLAGGTGSRLGGVDKAEINVGGGTLPRMAIGATGWARATVVVGPDRDVPGDVLITQEDPPGGGPVAAVAAGLRLLALDDAVDVAVVLACDMPFVDSEAIHRLVRELAERPGVDAVMYVDADGRRQYLAAAYRTARLADAITAVGDPAGASMRSVVAGLTVAEIAAHPELTLDCDTWQDVERTRRLLEER